MSSNAVQKFEINLEHDIDEQYQYEPGEVLRGNIALILNRTLKVKAVQIQIKGESSVSWEEETRAATTYRADETYINMTQDLICSVGEELISLDQGLHKFPLEFLLPQNLPSSFIGKYGSITYVVKATFKEDRRFGLSSMITSEPFLVLRKLDLALDKSLQVRKEESCEKRLWGTIAFCRSGKVTATLGINKCGHLPGEDIYMDAEIYNSSPRVVKAVQAAIIMHSTFHAKNKSRHNVQIVNKKRDEWEMGYGEGRRWKKVRLTIPPYIPESRLDGCDIIDIRYELLFRVEISGGTEIKVSMPVTVGTACGEDSISPRPVKLDNSQNYIMGPDQGEMGVHEGDDDINGDAIHDDVDLDMDDEEAEKFRHPMAPGDTRKNPLFSNMTGDADI